MDKTIFQIQMRSLAQCIEHLRTLDLARLHDGAQQYGTPADRELVAAVRGCIVTLPPTR